MFTGIVESQAVLVDIQNEDTNTHFTLHSPLAHEFTVDQSISHDGVCLTVTAVDPKNQTYSVTAVKETLDKTNLSLWLPQKKINIERCVKADGRFDGHIVQGHIDGMGRVVAIVDKNGSHEITIQHEEKWGLTVEKGSIAVNGVSLTVVNSELTHFQVVIIPYTWEYTNFHLLQEGDRVNLEFDILGKYLQKLWLIQTHSKSK